MGHPGERTDRDELRRELRRLTGRLVEFELERASGAREPIDLPPLPRTNAAQFEPCRLGCFSSQETSE